MRLATCYPQNDSSAVGPARITPSACAPSIAERWPRVGTLRTMQPATGVAHAPPTDSSPRLFAFRFEAWALDHWYIALGLFVTTLLLPPAVQFVSDGVAWIAAGSDPRQYL